MLAGLDATERAELERLIVADVIANPWRPLIDLDDSGLPTPQQRAYESPADFTLYGGGAGGGKSDLLIGLALTAHKRSLILRREAKQLAAIIDRIAAIRRTRDGFNGATHRWTLPDGRTIDLGGCKDPGDERAYQGQPHDLIGVDEAAELLEMQFRFIVGWNRSTDPNQRCRVVAATNPPTSAEGE